MKKKIFLELHNETNVTPLTQSVNFGYPSQEMKKILKREPISFIALYQNESVILYADVKHWTNVGRMIAQKAKTNPKFFESLLIKSDKVKDRLIKKIHSLGRNIVDDIDNKKLIALIKELSYDGFLLSVWSQPGAIVDHYHNIFSDLLTDTIKNAKGLKSTKLQPGEIFNILTTSPYYIISEIATRELIKLQDKLKSNKKNKDELVEKYLSKWFWLHYGHIGPELSNRQLVNELKRKQNINDKVLLRKKQTELFRKLEFKKEEKNLFKVAQILVYLKGMRAEICHGVFAFLNQVVEKVESDTGINKIYLWYLSIPELVKYLESGKVPSEAELKNRRKYSVWFPIDVFKTKVYTGAAGKKFLKDNLMTEKKDIESSSELKGNTAFPGKVFGKVKIVNRPQDMKKLEKGDILVSIQTTPELLPAMKKASAFVTDMGGLTCHAAIVAREMKVPCVVGVRAATKVLKDGDQVEVDATKGIIKKI